MASVIDGGLEIVTQVESAEPVENNPAEKTGKGKTPKEPKAKKPSAPKKPRNPPTHPPYEEMIKDAIVTLKEKTGSSQYAITKFIEEKQKQLPSNFKKLLLFHLKKLGASGKLVRVKSSFKLPPVRTSVSKPVEKKKPVVAKVPVKPKSVASKAKATAKAKPTAKPKAKPAVVKTKAVAAKSKAAPAKAKPAAKPKAAPATTKKVAAKPKLKEKPAKASRTSTRTSPGKKVDAHKPAPKKAMAVKKAPAKSVKSPAKAKKATTARRGRK